MTIYAAPSGTPMDLTDPRWQKLGGVIDAGYTMSEDDSWSNQQMDLTKRTATLTVSIFGVMEHLTRREKLSRNRMLECIFGTWPLHPKKTRQLIHNGRKPRK